MKKLRLITLILFALIPAIVAQEPVSAQHATELTLLDEIKIVNPQTGEPEPTRAIAFSSDGAKIAVGTWYNGHVYIIEDHRVTQFFNAATSDIVTLAFMPDNTTLLVGTFDKNIQVWDLTTVTRKRQFAADVWSMNLSTDGELLAHGQWYGQVIVRNLQTGSILLEGQQDAVVSGLVFDQAKKRLISSSWDGTVAIYDLASGEQLQRFGPYYDKEDPNNLRASLEGLALSEDEQQLYLVAHDGFRIIDLETGKVLTYWNVEFGRVYTHAMSADRRLWAVVTGSLPLQVFDMSTGKEVFTVSTEYVMFGVALHPAETMFATTDPRDGTVRLWGMTGATPLAIPDSRKDSSYGKKLNAPYPEFSDDESSGCGVRELNSSKGSYRSEGSLKD